MGNYPTINPDKIPQTLKEKRIWVPWVYKRTENGGKLGKVPMRFGSRGGLIRQGKNRELYTFNKAHRLSDRHQCGIGLFIQDDVGGLDIDDVGVEVKTIDDLPQKYREIVNDFEDTYIETSVGKKGVHILGIYYGENGYKKVKEKGLEFFINTNRFLTFSGRSLNGSKVSDITEGIDSLYSKFTTVEKPPILSNNEGVGWQDTDEEFIRFMENNKLKPYGLVWAGDEYTFERDYSSDDSAMDQALFNYLLFFLGPDEERIERLALQSGWYQNNPSRQRKWARRDYVGRTIARSIKDHKGGYYEESNKNIDSPTLELQPAKNVYDGLIQLKSQFPRLMQDIDNHIQGCSYYRQPLFSTFTTIFLIGCLINRNISVDGQIWGNLYIKMLGKTGCGKDIHLKYVRECLEQLTIPYITNVGSRAGLEDAIFESNGLAILFADESRPNFTDNAIALMDYENELFTSHGGLLRPRRLSLRGPNASPPPPIKNPFFSKLSATTVEAQFGEQSWDRMVSGEASRTLFLLVKDRPLYVEPNFRKDDMLENVPELKSWYKSMIPEIDSGDLFSTREISFSPAAQRYYVKRQVELDIKLNDPTLHKITYSLGTRVGELSRKLAFIFTIADNPKAETVPRKWIKVAFDFMVAYVNTTRETILPHVAKDKRMVEVNHAFDLLKSLMRNKKKTSRTKTFKKYAEHIMNNKMPRSAFMQLLHIDAENMDMIERTLVASGRIKVEKAGSRGQLVVWAIIEEF